MPGSSTQAAHNAMMATNDSISMPPYPTKRACDSRSIIFGVVPDEISAWKPDTAPHAMVMNRNGNSGPENTGPVPSAKRVTACIFSSGWTM